MNTYEVMLRELTDDQALELALEVQKDIHRRDPVVKRLANKVVGDQKEFHAIATKALEEELQEEKKRLCAELRLGAREEIQQMHAAGNLKLFAPDEAKKTIDDIKSQELASFMAELEKPKLDVDMISIQISGDVVTGEYKYQGKKVRMQHMCGVARRERDQLVVTLKRLCGLA